MSRHATAASTFVFAIVAISCGIGQSRGESGTGLTSLDTLQDLRSELMAFIGEPTCSETGQCRALPFGAKPCGGPWSYLIYSTATSDSVQVTEAAERYAAYERALNRREGRVSDCSFVSPPVLDCVNGRCDTVPSESHRVGHR